MCLHLMSMTVVSMYVKFQVEEGFKAGSSMEIRVRKPVCESAFSLGCMSFLELGQAL